MYYIVCELFYTSRSLALPFESMVTPINLVCEVLVLEHVSEMEK